MTHHHTAPSSAAGEYPDDGHIFVCVRVRDVPHNAACMTSSNGNANSGTRTSTVARKSMVRDAQKICVSVVENVVVMHDPKALDDAVTIAKDGNNIVQLLTNRANCANAGVRPSRKTCGGGVAAGVANTRTNSRRTTTGGGGRVCGAGNNFLVPTGTANYYELDHCIASMEQSQLMQMPLIRTSDFMQPPAYGTQEDVYRRTAMHAVKAAVEGINSCVFAYGQTGSGKTYTLFGDTANIRRDPGIVPRTVDDLFGQLEAVKESYRGNEETDYSYNVQLSFFEIYQNEVYCLFSRQGPLHVQYVRDPAGKKETMTINDLQQQVVTAADKAYPLIEMGLRRRQTAETGMNARSSRSHAILQIRVVQYRTNRDTRETVEHQATINLVDLAGSERQKTANTDGKSRDEGIQINQSLATLARVINDIASGAKFVNYRDSLLTMVLKDNLGGNSKTFMVANISPIAFSFSESCATLTYAKDVRKIRNRPMVNKTFQTRANLLEQNSRLKLENEKLKEQMEAWVRNLQKGGGAAGVNLEEMPIFRAIQQRIASADVVGGDSGGLTPASQWMGALPKHGQPLRGIDALQVASWCNESFLSATSAGMTAPLLISSHRRYTSVAGIGGSCVEGGVVRVSALVKETMRFPLRRVLDGVGSGEMRSAEAAAEEAEETVPADGEECTATRMATDDIDVSRDEEREGRCASASPDAVATGCPQNYAAALGTDDDLGVLQLDRVAQRSCEQRYFVHFVPPTTDDGIARLIDVQVNGKSIGAKGRRELHHGDVVCAYLEDSKHTAKGLHAQSLIAFHYVDLNALSRNTSGAAFGATSTLGQIAVSVDIPEDLENLTLEGIKQLQRDNAKLLDMVRHQAETIDFQCARASVSPLCRANLMEGISPIGRLESVSPDPRAVELSPSAVMPLEPRTTVVEAFRRLSEPHGLRGCSVLPADVEADELLRRAAAQSASQQRLDGAVKENEKLHRTVVSRNATLDALARRLAELEAGDDATQATRASSSSSSALSGSDAARSAFSKHASSVCLSLSVDRDGKGATVACLGGAGDGEEEEEGVSVTRVSSPSATRDASEAPQPKKTKKAAGDDEDDLEEEPIGDGKKRVVYENTEGARERYQAVVREREQFDRIVELEDVIRDLRERLAELEGRLRFARDETLEQQIFREQAEAEQAALLEELEDLRRENSELRGDNATLEAFLAKDEQALADAARLAEEELDRRTSVLVDRITAMKALARMWKQRTMKYIAMGYGAGEGCGAASAEACLSAIPWDDLRAAETVAIAKRRLGGTLSTGCSPTRDNNSSSNSNSNTGGICTAEMAQAIEEFEKDTAEENLRALEYALLHFEQENQRLLDEIGRIQAELQGYKDLIDRLRREKADMERQLADATGTTDEERRRMQTLLDSTNRQLAEAEDSLKATQGRLDEAMSLCDNNKRRAVKSNERLLAQQKRTIEDLEAQLKRLRDDLASRDEELRNLTRCMEDQDTMGGDGVAKSYELRSRIEEMVTDTMDDGDAPTGYSVFPAGYEFSDEMVALIRICLRILLDRLKMELYVLNSQSVHKFSLLIHGVKARTEAHFHTFMHQLRDAVSQMTGRMVRPGGKWALSEADVLSNLVDHRRRQVGDALNGLLIWYDHWDSAAKTEHVAYMELIRNADRIMQMARIVRRESLLNTNATSTSLMTVPGKNGSSEKPLVAEGSRRKDKTVLDSCKILSRLNSSTRQSNLARAVNHSSATFSRPTVATREDANLSSGGGAESTPFNRSATATALALSQGAFSFSRTATGTRGSVQQSPQPNSSRHAEGCPPFTRCPHGVARTFTTVTPSACASSSTPMRQTKPNAGEATAVRQHSAGEGAAAGAPQCSSAPSPAARANFARLASAGVLPVSDADVTYVASTDVAEAMSINSFNFSRRMSATPAELAARSEMPLATTCKLNHTFTRCHTSIPRPQKQQQRESMETLRRHTSAVQLQTRVSGSGGGRRRHGQPSGTNATGAFARSKTLHSGTTAPPLHASSWLAHKSSDLPSRNSLGSVSLSSAGSPSVRGSVQGSANLMAFYPNPVGDRQQGSGSDSRVSQRRSSTLRSSGVKPQVTTSFYSPAVLQSLRARSTSDANRTGPAAGAGIKSAGSKLKSSKKKLTTTNSTTLSRTSSGLPSKKTSACAASFQKTQTVPQFSGVVKGRLSSENVPSTATSAPPVPKLNFAGLAGNC